MMCILGLSWLISYGFLERCGTPALSYLGGVVGAQGGGVCAFTCAPLRRGSRELGAGEDGSPSPHVCRWREGGPRSGWRWTWEEVLPQNHSFVAHGWPRLHQSRPVQSRGAHGASGSSPLPKRPRLHSVPSVTRGTLWRLIFDRNS